MITVAVAGVAGRMGSRIAQLVCEAEDMDLVGGWERPDHSAIGKPLRQFIPSAKDGLIVSQEPSDIIQQAKVVIDFTTSEATVEHCKVCASYGVPIVIGTTGLSMEQSQIIRSCGDRIPIVISPNMSVGVNVLFKLIEYATKLLGPDFDVEIVEAHHRFKKDAPSGTAIKLGQIIAEARSLEWSKVARFAREGIIGERGREEIGIQTLRAGDIVGEHTVIFGSLGERIEITHRAHSRDNFARGAIRAARWVIVQNPGIYDMQDVLGLRA
ncbi:MAG: 4-hydroxy-tetrahydrodipicolinate reductase [Syntrophobacterales bacterium]|nr:4-hydroxy-tetrahydrodipicolinate reductase [Syntrophobacterales bacterium]